MGLYLGGLTLYPTVVEPLAPPTTAPTTLIASLAWLAEPSLPLRPALGWAPSTTLVVAPSASASPLSLAWLADPVLPWGATPSYGPTTALPFTAATAVSTPTLAWLTDPALPLTVWPVALYTRYLRIAFVGGVLTGPRFRRTAVWRVGSRPWEDWG